VITPAFCFAPGAKRWAKQHVMGKGMMQPKDASVYLSKDSNRWIGIERCNPYRGGALPAMSKMDLQRAAA